jgi:hypothetical protein
MATILRPVLKKLRADMEEIRLKIVLAVSSALLYFFNARRDLTARLNWRYTIHQVDEFTKVQTE